MNVVWTPKNIARLEKMRAEGLSYNHIAQQIGTTESAAKAAYKRHVSGRPDEAVPRDRGDDWKQWAQKNADHRNAYKRQKRAEGKARKGNAAK